MLKKTRQYQLAYQEHKLNKLIKRVTQSGIDQRIQVINILLNQFILSKEFKHASKKNREDIVFICTEMIINYGELNVIVHEIKHHEKEQEETLI